MSEDELPRCAAVVVNYGSHALLALNLATLAASAPDLDVVVVDNWTSQEERSAVAALCAAHGWQLVGQPTNLGFGGGVNAGAAVALAAGARQLLLLNPDARLDASGLRRLREVVAADPFVLAAPVVRTADGRVWSDGTDLYLDRGAMRATRKRPAGNRRPVREWLSGACLLVSEELWTAVGGFDDRYFLYWEDVDLSWRAVDAGARLLVVRDAEAVHDEGGTQGEGGARTRSATYYHYNIRNRLVFAAHHLGPADQLRWAATALPEAWAILLRGGRRQLLASVAPWRAAATGTRDGLRALLRPPVAGGPVRVLQSFPRPRPTTNPYITMLEAALAEHPGLAVDTFSWRRALTGRHQVFHAHWPEILVNGASPVKKAVRQALFVAVLVRFRWRGTTVVRTLHNLELPSGISRREVALLRWFERRTDLLITINTSSTVPERPSETILHGHYRTWFSSFPRSERVAGRLAYFGLIRRYKAVDTLIQAFRGLPAPDLSLQVGGQPSSPELAEELVALAGDDPRVALDLRYLTDAELVAAASASEVVVLPYREMHNSGGVLAALSLDRPVLVPDNEVNRRLADEVGPGWVHRYQGELAPQDLRDALAAAGAVDGRPDLSARDWGTTAELHLRAYRRALALTRRGRRVHP